MEIFVQFGKRTPVFFCNYKVIVVKIRGTERIPYHIKIEKERDRLWEIQKIVSAWLKNQRPLIGHFLD